MGRKGGRLEPSETVVIASLKNGRAFLVLRTPGGMRLCLEEDRSNPKKWRSVSSLTNCISRLGCYEIQVVEDPNADVPKFRDDGKRFLGLWDFERNVGTDFVSTGRKRILVREGGNYPSSP